MQRCRGKQTDFGREVSECMLPRNFLTGLFGRVFNMAVLGSKGVVPSTLWRTTLSQPRLARAFIACTGERPTASPFAAGRLIHASPHLAAARGRPVTTGAAAVRARPTSVWLGSRRALRLVFSETVLWRLPSPGLAPVWSKLCTALLGPVQEDIHILGVLRLPGVLLVRAVCGRLRQIFPWPSFGLDSFGQCQTNHKDRPYGS